jgi:hypothetical protein
MRQALLSRGWYSSASRFGSLLLVAVLAGCGFRGTVSGQVTYQNKPVAGGWVMFVPVRGGTNPIPAALDENGHYELTAPTGEFLISVDNRELDPRKGAPPPTVPDIKLPPGVKAGGGKPAAPPKGPNKWFEIPSKYYTVEKSELRYTVIGGSQTYDIDLK